MLPGPKKTVTVTLPLEVYETLKAQAEAGDRKVAVYIRRIIRRYLDEHPEGPEDWWLF